ncbi:hypothetical protein Mgra_00007069 [Meloidogyne graminicola]
MTFPF